MVEIDDNKEKSIELKYSFVQKIKKSENQKLKLLKSTKIQLKINYTQQ